MNAYFEKLKKMLAREKKDPDKVYIYPARDWYVLFCVFVLFAVGIVAFTVSLFFSHADLFSGEASAGGTINVKREELKNVLGTYAQKESAFEAAFENPSRSPDPSR